MTFWVGYKTGLVQVELRSKSKIELNLVIILFLPHKENSGRQKDGKNVRTSDVLKEV